MYKNKKILSLRHGIVVVAVVEGVLIVISVYIEYHSKCFLIRYQYDYEEYFETVNEDWNE